MRLRSSQYLAFVGLVPPILFVCASAQGAPRESGFAPPHSSDFIYSPDGKSIAAIHVDANSFPKDVLIWDVRTQAIRHTITLPHHNEPAQVVYSRDSRLLAISVSSVFDSEVELYDARTATRIRAIASPSLGEITSLNFSPNGKVLAIAAFTETEKASGKDRVSLWRVSTGKSGVILGDDQHGIVSAPAFSPDGKTLATLDGEGAISFRNVRNWRIRSSIALHSVSPNTGYHQQCMTFSKNGERLLISGDRVSVYNVRTHRLLWEQMPPDGYTEDYLAAFSPNGDTVAYSKRGEKSLRICESQTGKVLREIQISDSTLHSPIFSPNGKWMTASGLPVKLP
ncbi:hypothetical protein CCAX7_009870 [Capsulimonas corticalis]|uniref:Uncharacterized protein n=1 Tax=Capsulimonas corticalis TaxID=2219043 RepID=A0A402CUC4_9BACT|nr:WD40 repeat domain-containing protein [Capsulimonas corticalis]BDI28936.1 hypothetical protein CCAX7_009870 [Capsulimonas corticalis]